VRGCLTSIEVADGFVEEDELKGLAQGAHRSNALLLTNGERAYAAVVE